jgi:pyrroline-5-carboxylate reductase
MPNTPASVGEGMSAIAGGTSATAEHLARASALLGAVGRVVTLPEKHLDAVTAVSGSGPAYVMYVAEAMIDAGVLLGLPRDIATTLATQTLYGSAKLLRDSGTHPTVLRENVTSPGGTTAAALRTLDDHGVKAAFVAALEAARDRSQELAAQARTH